MNKFKVGDRVRVLPSKFNADDNIPGEWTIVDFNGRWFSLGHHVKDFMRYSVVDWRLEVVSGS